MKLYKINNRDIRIIEIEATRETKDSYWALDYSGRERRSAKITSYDCVFNTYQEAKQYLIDKKSKEIQRTKKELAILNIELDKIEKL